MSEQAHLGHIKIRLKSEDHDRVRLAAAVRRLAMSEFCRQAAIAEADKLTKGLPLPERTARPSLSARRRQRS